MSLGKSGPVVRGGFQETPRTRCNGVCLAAARTASQVAVSRHAGVALGPLTACECRSRATRLCVAGENARSNLGSHGLAPVGPGRARRAASRPVCPHEKNPAWIAERKLRGAPTTGPHTAPPPPAVAPRDLLRSAGAYRRGIGRPLLQRCRGSSSMSPLVPHAPPQEPAVVWSAGPATAGADRVGRRPERAPGLPVCRVPPSGLCSAPSW